jgi:hypothetical protein
MYGSGPGPQQELKSPVVLAQSTKSRTALAIGSKRPITKFFTPSQRRVRMPPGGVIMGRNRVTDPIYVPPNLMLDNTKEPSFSAGSDTGFPK